MHRTDHVKEHTECTGLARLRRHCVLMTGHVHEDTQCTGLARYPSIAVAHDCIPLTTQQVLISECHTKHARYPRLLILVGYRWVDHTVGRMVSSRCFSTVNDGTKLMYHIQ